MTQGGSHLEDLQRLINQLPLDDGSWNQLGRHLLDVPVRLVPQVYQHRIEGNPLFFQSKPYLRKPALAESPTELETELESRRIRC